MQLSTLVLLFGLCALALAGHDQHKEYMLAKNKVPKKPDLSHILVRGKNGQLAPLETLRKETICDECKEIVHRIDEILKDKTKLRELQMLLRIACNYAGDYKQQCENIVDNLETIAAEIEPMFADPEGFCTELSLCGPHQPSRYHRLAALYVKKYLGSVGGYSNDILCEECEFAVGELKTLLENKQMQDEIKEGLHEICGYLGGETAKECDKMVDQYFPELVQELEQLLADPKAVCQMLGLCNGERMTIQSLVLLPANRVATAKLTPSSQLPVVQPVRIESFLRMLKNLQTRQGNNAACLLCKMGLGGLLGYLRDDDSLQQKLADGIRNVACNKVLPADYKDGCNDFVGLYLKSVIYMTIEQFNAQEICDAIKACTAFDLRTLGSANEETKSELLCEACEVAADFLKHELTDAAFQQDVISELLKVCSVLPQNYKQQCSQMVSFYVPQVLNMLADQLRARQACHELQMCP